MRGSHLARGSRPNAPTLTRFEGFSLTRLRLNDGNAQTAVIRRTLANRSNQPFAAL